MTRTAPRVLQVVLSLHPGGTERLVLEIVRRLQAEVPMAVCCLDKAGAWGEQLQGAGIPVTTLGREEGFHPTLGRRVAQAASAHGASVVHAHHYSPFVYGSLARLWKPGLRVIYTEHGRLSDAPPSPKRRLANALFSLLPDEVYTVSADLKKHIVGEGFRAAKVGVIYNGIEVLPLAAASERSSVRAELNVDEHTLVIGTIGRLDPVKDFDTMIRAVDLLGRDTRCLLLLIGDGAERTRLEQLAAATGRPDLFRFLGHREDARRWLAGCDVYANSSIHEGVSLTILEAMSASLPVVATKVGGTPEIVDAQGGRLVPARDADAFAAALRDLAHDATRRTAMGRAGRQRVEERFTIERMVGEYRDAYYRVS